MAKSVTISRRDAVELTEQAALKLTGGNKTEAVALELRLLLDRDARAGDLFGVDKGSVRIGTGVDLTPLPRSGRVAQTRICAQKRVLPSKHSSAAPEGTRSDASAHEFHQAGRRWPFTLISGVNR